ncbi:MAG: GntR family transcriptional regulator [Rhodospirillales bacterium]|nr:GntR family transcriptional regulator [Rhodospirillales bacterium]
MQETVDAGRGSAAPKLPLRPVGRETVQDRVYRQFRELILNGEIEPGQTITIQSLSEAFQVSAMPVREALRRLMAEQALTVVSGRSVGIPALTRERLADLRRVRREVEPLAAAWAAQRVTPADLQRLAELIERMQIAADQQNGRHFVPANHDFHFTIYRAAASPALLGIIESLWLQIGPYFHVLRASDNWHTANTAHRMILDALRRGDGGAAAAALHRDIEDAATTLEDLLR